MVEFEDRFSATQDGRRLHFRDYSGPLSRTPVVCVAGARANLHTFDFIASHIAKTRRVLCIGLRGRGRSDYDPDLTRYGLKTEASDVHWVANEAKVTRAVLLGTSRGGLTALVLAARTDLAAGLILNDSGPQMETSGMARHVPDVGPNVSFPSWGAAAEAVKSRHGPWFPGMPDDKWLFWARRIYREENGRVIPDSDLRIGVSFRIRRANRPPGGSWTAWPAFQSIPALPMLVLRGEFSDFVSEKTVARMKLMKPGLVAVTVKGRGHTPLMDEPDSLAAIDTFLERIP